MKHYRITILAILATALLANAQIKIHDKTFTIETPAGWDTLHMYGMFAAMSPLETADKFRENLNVALDSEHADVALDEYFTNTINGIEEEYKLQRSQIEFKKIALGKNKIAAGYVQYQTPSTANPNVMLNVTQIIVKGKSLFYVITLTTMPQTFSKYKDAFLKSIDTFTPLQ